MTKKFYEWLIELIADGNVHPFYTSTEWRSVREKVLKAHHYECYLCRQKGKLSTRGNSTPLSIHHVKPLKRYPKLALSPYISDENGRRVIQLMPLCHQCHEEIEGRADLFKQRTGNNVNSKFPERW